jgi:ATP-dependent DNA helicase RecQ
MTTLLGRDGTHSRSGLAQLCGLSRRKATTLLNLLEEAGAVTVEGGRRAGPGRSRPYGGRGRWAAAEVFERRRRMDRSRIEMMRGYAETPSCRRQYLLGYFGEQLDEPCGRCDVCDGDRYTDRDHGRVTGTARHTATGHEETVPAPGQRAPFEPNDRVRHAEWGEGTVMRTEEDRLVVLFEQVGYKMLSLAAVQESDLLTGA